MSLAKVGRWSAAVFLGLFLLFEPLAAQPTSGEIDAIATGGAGWFLDGPVHRVVGASLRAHFSGRFAVEPEFLYMHGSSSDQDQVLVASAIYYLATSSRVAPFLTGGLGLFRHEDGSFSTTGPEAIFGAGVRVDVTDRIFVEPRFRIGVQDVHWTLTGSVGFVLRRK